MVSRPAQMMQRAATWYWCVARATGRRGAMVMVLTLVGVLVRVVGGIRLASCVRSRRQRRRRWCCRRAGWPEVGGAGEVARGEGDGGGGGGGVGWLGRGGGEVAGEGEAEGMVV